jgi:hypothetical protein
MGPLWVARVIACSHADLPEPNQTRCISSQTLRSMRSTFPARSEGSPPRSSAPSADAPRGAYHRPPQERAPAGPQPPGRAGRRRRQRRPRGGGLQLQPPPAVARRFAVRNPGHARRDQPIKPPSSRLIRLLHGRLCKSRSVRLRLRSPARNLPVVQHGGTAETTKPRNRRGFALSIGARCPRSPFLPYHPFRRHLQASACFPVSAPRPP